MNKNKRMFRQNDRAEAIRAHAIAFPDDALDTFIAPLQADGWTLGHNRLAQLKTIDNALRPHRGGPSNMPGYLLKNRPYTGVAVATEAVEAVATEAVEAVATEAVEAVATESPVTVRTDSALVTTLDGLVTMAQQRIDEHMTLATQWETIKTTITSLVSESQEREEQLRSAQAEVEATQRKLNAVVAAMSNLDTD